MKEVKKARTGKYSVKWYHCRECRYGRQVGTNHWGEVYERCPDCCKLVVWDCDEPMPEGFEKPEPWRIVKLSEVAEIMSLDPKRHVLKRMR